MKRNEQIDIRRDLAVAGAFSFLCCCARACLIPFLTLYFRQLGLTPAMTGIVMGTKHLVALAWSPVASLLSKHYDKRRAVINASLVCSAAAALALLLVPLQAVRPQVAGCNRSDPSGGPTQSLGGGGLPGSVAPSMASSARTQTTNAITPPFHSGTLPGTKSSPNHHDHSHAQLPPLNATVVVEDGAREPTVGAAVVHRPAPSSGAPVRSKRSEEEAEQEEAEQEEKRFTFLGSLKALDPQHQLFFLILVIVAAWELAAAPLEGTADDGLYEYLDSADASDRHGGPAVWGLLGAACGVGGAGLLVSRLSCVVAGGLPRSAAHFFCYAAVAAAALPVAARLPLHLDRKRDRAGGLLKAARLVRGSPRALLCAATALLVGVASSAVDNFLLWQMQDHGSGELHMGLSLAAALLSRAAFPPLAPRVSKLLSPGRVLAAAAACLGVQCFYYSFLWGPWAAAPAQALSCFSGGALWWAVGRQCEDVATPGAERSVRRLYGALALQLGSGLGSFAGGFVAQRFGLAWLFRGAALGVLAWCACLPLLQFKAPRQRRINYSRLLAADASEASDTESEQERDWLEKAMDDDRSRNNNNNNNGRRVNH
ncbi:major facilitator superfamily domain-containing protein 6-like [Pseudoliparis swirei]|uniref:major facilitator superfamily domain-containing protein 6-like n=1 Tax=Pseudoliparis swirei TaxID=2059687 RepID=UPI0024BD7F03|nr:major facilitator superfamily domain-containing protein 6-like [Pseudoliparis swirei]